MGHLAPPCLFQCQSTHCPALLPRAGFTERRKVVGGGRQWAEERLWEVQLKVAAAFRHHTLWGWGVGSQHILPAARWEWRCMVSPPLMKAGRQRDQSCQNHSQSCLRKLNAGLLWALRADGPSSTGIQASLPQENIVCKKFCAPPTAISMPGTQGLLTGLLPSRRLHDTLVLPASLSAHILQLNPREHSGI